MPVTYTNRKGTAYYLCQGLTKTGKLRYYFAREPKDDSPTQIPDGYRISESVNGTVSLIKDQPQLILPQESAAVEKALSRHPKSNAYRMAIKNNRIIIYERLGPDLEMLGAILEGFSPLPATVVRKRLQEQFEKTGRFSPILRFILADPKEHTFIVERRVYLGTIEDWIEIGVSGKLAKIARQLILKLGTDEFFELY